MLGTIIPRGVARDFDDSPSEKKFRLRCTTLDWLEYLYPQSFRFYSNAGLRARQKRPSTGYHAYMLITVSVFCFSYIVYNVFHSPASIGAWFPFLGRLESTRVLPASYVC